MTVTKPLIVFGTGRSGTTMFHYMLSDHPGLAWLPGRLCDAVPGMPELAAAYLRALDSPLLCRILRGRVKPGECYNLWEQYATGFSEPCRDLSRGDVTEKQKHAIRAALSKVLTRRRNRLLLKITGWPRLGYMHAVFPDAKFIHFVRDGRAVANSLLHVYFWRGTHGPDRWRWGALPADLEEEWERHDRSFVALAGLQWRIIMDAAEKAAESVDPSQLMEVRYERLCEDPLATMREVLEFAELSWAPGFERCLRTRKLKPANHKWRTDLNTSQQGVLEDVLGTHLARYGYA